MLVLGALKRSGQSSQLAPARARERGAAAMLALRFLSIGFPLLVAIVVALRSLSYSILSYL